MNKLLLTSFAVLALCTSGFGQITSGQYVRPNSGGTVTIKVTAPAPMSGNYTTTVTDSGGKVSDPQSTPTGNAPGEVETFGEPNGVTTSGTNSEGEKTTGGTYRGKNGDLQEKNPKTGKWQNCRKKPTKKKKNIV